MNTPSVYLLGDSISAGYAPFVEAALVGVCAVRLRPANGRDSNHLRACAPVWLDGPPQAVIHFNCGLHDIRRPFDTGALQVPLEVYVANLRQLVSLLSQRAGALIWARTTPVLDGQRKPTKHFNRYNRDIDAYNAAADQVMSELRVPINDLHGAVLAAGVDRCLSADGVHMTEFANRRLGEQVAAAIRAVRLP